MTPSKKSRYPLDRKKKFIEIRARGLSLQAAAKALKVAKGTLVEWNKEFQAEIAAARAVELEALQEEYYLTREAKIRLFGERLNAVLSELERRELSGIPTAKLFDILAGSPGRVEKGNTGCPKKSCDRGANALQFTQLER